MSNEYNISYSLNITPTMDTPEQVTKSAAETLYAFRGCEIVDLPAGRVLLVSKDSASQCLMTKDVAIALGFCREFQTLQHHADNLAYTIPELQGDTNGIRKALEAVRDGGLLQTSKERLQCIESNGKTSRKAAPSRVFITSCDRPDAIERLLSSMSSKADLTLHESLFLLDDSRDIANAEKNREHVDQFNASSPVKMIYFGAAEKSRCIDNLIQADPALEESIRFLLDQARWPGQHSCGMSRTWCLLLSVGYRTILVDDDVICTAIDSPHRKEGVHFSDQERESDFYASINDWLPASETRDQDPLSGHLSALGLGVGEVLSQFGLENDVELRGSQDAVLGRISDDSSVKITQCGTLGDPGTGSNAWYFSLEGPSLQRFLADPRPTTDKFIGRQCWLGYPRPTFNSRSNMSQITGLDNSELLPPYFPVWRFEDLLFGVMVDFLYPTSLVLNFPWAVPHLPLEQREKENNFGPGPEVGSISPLIDHIARKAKEVRPLKFESRYSALISLLRDLAESPENELNLKFRHGLSETQARSIRAMTKAIEEVSATDPEWREVVEQRMKAYYTALGRTEVPVLLEGALQGMPENEIWQHFRRYVTGYAQCLEDWPRIRQAAANIVALH